MKYSLVVLSTLFCISSLVYAQPDTLWTRTYGGIDNDHGEAIQLTNDGGYIITGDVTPIGSDNRDVWLIKTDSQGQEEWNQTFGGISDDKGFSVQPTAEGGYIISATTNSFGSGDYDFWLIKTDSLGEEQWNQTFGGSSPDYCRSVQQTTDGGFVMVGSTQSFGNNGVVWLIKADSLGQEVWSQTFGASSGGSAVQQTQDGGFIITGSTSSLGNGGYDVWLIKTDSQGNEEWNHTFGGSNWDSGFSGQETMDGGYIITGGTNSFGNGGDDLWLIKTDSQGQEEWNQTFGGSEWETGFSVQETTNGGYIITGGTTSFGHGDRDVWVIRTDSLGVEEWNQTYGGVLYDVGSSVRQTTDRGYIIAGSTLSFGSGGWDAWVLRLSSELPNVVINEVMNNPSVINDSAGEWFELFNPNQDSIDISDWTISDLGTDVFTISGPLHIQANSYIVLGNNNNPGTNGGVNVDYVFSNFTLGNSSDEIILKNSNGILIDSVAWDGGPNFPDPNGASMALNAPQLDNSLGANWTTSTIRFGAGDYGTPGVQNFFGFLEISELNVHFDTTAVGVTKNDTIYCKNVGNTQAIIDTVFTSGLDFSSPGMSNIILNPSDSVAIPISFTPQIYGDASAFLTIISDDLITPVLEIPMDGFGYFPVSHISLSTDTLRFASTMVGGLTTQELFIYNVGEEILVIDSIYGSTNSFSIDHDAAAVEVGDSLICVVSFHPAEINQYLETSLLIECNDPDLSPAYVVLQGEGTAPAPIMTISADELYFGVVVPGEAVTRQIAIYNEGMLDLEIEEFTISGSELFTTTFSDASIAPGDSVIVNIQFLSAGPVNQVIATAEVVATGLLTMSVELNAGYFGPRFNVSLIGDDLLGDGSQDNPFRSIQRGINVASMNDTILVAPGSYVENISFNGKSVTLGSYYLIYPDSAQYIENTVINGNQNGSVVRINQVTDSTASLEGFAITNGSSSNGGGVFIDNSSNRINLKNLHIYNNISTLTGGGISIMDSPDGQLFMMGCRIENNSAHYGGGIYAILTQLDIQESNFIYNTCESDGGGMLLIECWGQIIDVDISNNVSEWTGGGFIAQVPPNPQEKSLMFIGVLIADNTASPNGGASAFQLIGIDASVEYYHMEKCTIVGNYHEVSGVRMSGTQLAINNSIFVGNGNIVMEFPGAVLDVSYSNIEGGESSINPDGTVNWGPGNIDDDPLFCGPESNDYHLSELSPCVGSGLNGVNMGALDVGCLAPVALDQNILPTEFVLRQNYPNPFNPTTTISYALPQQSMVNLTVFDIQGREVMMLRGGLKPSGNYDVQWNGTDQSGVPVSTGVYFCRLRAGDYSKTIKMVYLR